MGRLPGAEPGFSEEFTGVQIHRQRCSRPGPLILGVAMVTATINPALHTGSAQEPAADRSPHSKVALVSEVRSVTAGEPFTAALRFSLDPGWHTYWINAGDAGLPLRVDWELPKGFEVGPLEWPVPQRIPVPPLMSYGFEDELLVLIRVTPPADLVPGRITTLSGTVDWLVCADVCLTASGSVALQLPVTSGPASAPGRSAAVIRDVRSRLPGSATDWHVRGWSDSVGYLVELIPPDSVTLPAPYLFVDQPGLVEHALAQQVTRIGSTVRLRVPRSEFATEDATRVSGVLVSDVSRTESPAWWIDAVLDSTAPEGAAATDPFAHAPVQHTGGLADHPVSRINDAPLSTLNVIVTAGSLFALTGGLLVALFPQIVPGLRGRFRSRECE